MTSSIPTVDTLPNTILIKFTSTKDDQAFFCSVKPTIPFRKIFQIYCQHQNLQEGDTVNFLFEGHKILPNLTPQDIKFPDGGEIDVMSYAGGGGCKRL